jgi:AraC-like DNA-binding protein
MKQDMIANRQDADVIVACGEKEEVFYPNYVSPLGVRRFSGAARIGPASGVNGILFGHAGSVAIGDGPEIAAPFLMPVDRFARVDANAEGWLVAYRPEAINQSFVNWPALPAEAETDPFAIRDRELLESALPSRDPLDARYLSLSPDESQFVLRLFANIEDLLENKRDVYWPCRSKSFFLEILLFFWQRPKPADSGLPRSKAQRVHEWLRVHYPERFSLVDLTRNFNSNRTTLQEEFRGEYGMSIMDAAGEIRIDAASALMRNTELSLSEIAVRSGFGDYSNFYREFRRRKGETPKRFRERIKTVRVY